MPISLKKVLCVGMCLTLVVRVIPSIGSDEEHKIWLSFSKNQTDTFQLYHYLRSSMLSLLSQVIIAEQAREKPFHYYQNLFLKGIAQWFIALLLDFTLVHQLS